jgi:cytochrome c556
MARLRNVLLAGAAAALVACVAGMTIASAGVGEDRSKAMKEMGGSMKVVKLAIAAGGPAADIEAAAKKIAEISTMIPSLFPEGSDTEDDSALPDIWTNWDDFTAKAKSLGDEAGLLASAAAGGDMATVGAQFDKVGGACGACHKSYRAKKE